MDAFKKILQEQKDYYESLLNNVPTDFAIFNTEHRYEFVNTGAFPGQYVREWVIGKTDYEYLEFNNFPKNIAEQRRKHFTTALKEQKMVEFEEVTEASDGNNLYYLRRYLPVMSGDQTVGKVISYGIDITGLRHRELEMQKRAGIFRRLVNSMDQLVVIVHRDLTISFANKKWLNEIGVKTYQLCQYFLEGEKAFLETFTTVINDQEPDPGKEQKVIIESHTGNRLIMAFSIVPFFFTDTEEKSWAVFFTDITEHIRIEEELKKILEKEHKLNQLKSSFVSLVSHELRTPLAVIQSNNDLINQSAERQGLGETPFTKKYTKRIADQIDNMTKMLNDFLVAGKIESKCIRSKPEKVEVREILEQLFREYYSPWKDGRSLVYSFSGNRDPVWIDPIQLKHILVNLIDNAFKYSEGKTAPKVKVTLRAGSWSILIADKGIGIPPEDRNKMFNTFIRGSNVGDIVGTGVGLMIVKYFIGLNNGSVQLRSTHGKGTVFYLNFKNNIDSPVE
ncbi:MAG TPA: PAS domain-containing sensor histidine kinase [Sediminibacterium sp.]|nr:PAS domain-containing sensor histidine kinase [Sediminibacterium sp.]